MKEDTETVDTEPTDTETAEPLDEELSQIKDRTTDGWIEAHIDSIRSHDEDSVSITIQHPNKTEFVWNLAKPEVWSEESALVRLVENRGYSAETIHYLEGEQIPIRPTTHSRYPTDTSSTWELEIPHETLRSRIRAAIPWETIAIGGAKVFISFLIAAVPAGIIALLGSLTPLSSLFGGLSLIFWILMGCVIFIQLAVVPHMYRL